MIKKTLFGLCIALLSVVVSSCGFKEFGDLQEDFDDMTTTEKIESVMDNFKHLEDMDVAIQEKYVTDAADWYNSLSNEEKAEVEAYGETLDGLLREDFEIIMTKAHQANFLDDLEAKLNAMTEEEDSIATQ